MGATDRSGQNVRSLPIGDPHAELSMRLRAWRRRLRLSDLPGYMPYPHRRAETVSQDDIARVIGTTSWWYGELERGRVRHTDDYLGRVADALQLSAAERSVLYRLATGREPGIRSHVVSGDLGGAAEQRLVDAQRCPSIIVDDAFTAQAHNAEAESWFPCLRSGKPNLMRWAFLDPAARRHLPRWEQDWMPALLTQLRLAFIRRPDNLPLTEIIGDIVAVDDRARLWWEHSPTVEQIGPAIRGIRPSDGASTVMVELVTCTPIDGDGINLLMLIPVGPGEDPTGVVRPLRSGRATVTDQRA
ncbi:hypothetical protein ACIOBK_33685 [Micromonospora chokoriensis]